MSEAWQGLRVVMISGVMMAAISGCGGEPAVENTSASAEDQRSVQEAPAKPDSVTNPVAKAEVDEGVFPASLAKGFAHQVTESIPTGGSVAVGLICRGGGDMAYAGVKGASGLADGAYVARFQGSEGDSLKVNFATGAPDSGVGMGAAQSRLEDSKYTVNFEGVGLELTVQGCNSKTF